MMTMRPGGRLVTLTGPGGVGKTRLALAVARLLRDRFCAGTVFVLLPAVTDPQLVLSGIGRALGADLGQTGSPLQALAEQLGDDAWLLILDNLEQVTEVARDPGELLARCWGVSILATSRAVLGLRAEWEDPVPALRLPADPATASLEDIAASPAVALFADRARAVRPRFALTPGNAAAVAEICRLLEGLPLAIQLAAARTRLLDPVALRDRLARALDALGTGAVDMPERQQTLRATVEWSVGLLTGAERSLLEITAAFTDGWTVEAAATAEQRSYAQPAAASAAWTRTSEGPADLGDVVTNTAPTILIGLSTAVGAFTEPIVRQMAGPTQRPIIFPLSNPTSRSEADPADLSRWTGGRVLVATGSPRPPLELHGRQVPVAQSNNVFIFPAVGLGVLAARARRVTDGMLDAAARALGELSPAASDPHASLLPRVGELPAAAAHITSAIAIAAVNDGVAPAASDDELQHRVGTAQWAPHYESPINPGRSSAS
jgi:Malic enzyme, NAD binding domain/AAA domain